MIDLVHVGYHKCGSSWLENDVFPHSRHRTFLGRPDPLSIAVFRHIVGAEPWNRDMVAAYVRGHERVLMSWEIFSGEIWDGSRFQERTADRLLSVLRDPGVLIVVRAQPTMLVSLYAQYLNEGGWCSFERFLHGAVPGLDFDPRHLDYVSLIRHYVDRFGPERVKVMAYEMMRSDRTRFLTELRAFADEPFDPPEGRIRNPSPSRRRARRLAAWNRAFRSSRFNSDPWVALPGASRVRRYAQSGGTGDSLIAALGSLASRHAERYRAGNQELAAFMPGQPLADWGYPL